MTNLDATKAQDLSEVEARALTAGPYGRALLEQISAYAVPFFVIRHGRFSLQQEQQNQELFVNGTAFFIDLGRGPFGVTASHVLNDALSAEVVSLGLFPKQYGRPARPLVEIDDLPQRIIQKSDRRDIATFQISSREVERLGVSFTTVSPVIPDAKRGGVAFAGFPGAQRKIVEARRNKDRPEVTFSFANFPGFGVAESVSDRQITFQFDHNALVRTPGFSAPPADFDLGGMSGGPLLARVQTKGGIEHWAPAGVITEGKMLPELKTGFLFAARADCLRPDGRFKEEELY